jgi:hypothetical protein
MAKSTLVAPKWFCNIKDTHISILAWCHGDVWLLELWYRRRYVPVCRSLTSQWPAIHFTIQPRYSYFPYMFLGVNDDRTCGVGVSDFYTRNPRAGLMILFPWTWTSILLPYKYAVVYVASSELGCHLAFSC